MSDDTPLPVSGDPRPIQPPAAPPQYNAPPQYATPPQYGSPAPAYPAYGAPAYPPARPNSGLAITSLVCGIGGIVLFWLWLPVLASVVAVITGHMALKQTKENPALAGRGMAITGLITGYLGVALIIGQIAILVITFLLFGAFTLPFVFSR